jgi:lysophospholipase L1-like esterase
MLRKLLLPLIGGSALQRGYVNQGFEYLPTWLEKLNHVRAGTGRARVLCIGESTTRGTGAGTGANLNVAADQFSWPKYLADYLQARGVSASFNSWVGGGFGSGGTDSRHALGSGWAPNGNPSLGGSLMRNSTSTSTFSFSALYPFDTMRLWYLRFNNHDTFTYNIGGGTLATINADGGTAVLTSQMTVARGAHTINLQRTGVGNLNDIVGWELWDTTAPAVDVFNAGFSGAVMASIASTVNAAFSPLPALGSFAPDLTILCEGINDANGATAEGTFKTNAQAVIDKARLSGDIILSSGTPAAIAGGEAARRAYATYLRDLAISNGVTFVDIVELMGSYDISVANGWQGNGLHIDADGYAVMPPLFGHAMGI